MADVRKNNPNALQALFHDFVLLCRQWDLFGAELLALDGRKFTAVNSQHKNFTKTRLEKALSLRRLSRTSMRRWSST
jgi:transposase